jgi:hypothetical protein
MLSIINITVDIWHQLCFVSHPKWLFIRQNVDFAAFCMEKRWRYSLCNKMVDKSGTKKVKILVDTPVNY